MGLRPSALGTSLIGAAACVVAPAAAGAQTFNPQIDPVISPDYKRGRNISVTERPHPDYDALGIRLGSFNINTAASIGLGVTTNAYQNDANKQSDLYGFVRPFVRVGSDWNNHEISVSAAGDVKRYFHQTPLNQNLWYVIPHAGLDVTQDLKLNLDGQFGRFFESPYSSDATSEQQVLSNFYQTYLSASGVYTAGRIRVSAKYDRTTFSFNVLHFPDGTSRDQAFRNKIVNRSAVQLQYALSPTTAVYAQVAFDKARYATLFFGLPNRDSTGIQLSGGLTVDFAGFMRGSLGLGFSRRNYEASIYPDARGLSAQGKLEFFPSPITTITISGQRVIQDASIGSNGAFIDSRARIQLDHEFLENLYAGAWLSFNTQTLSETNFRRKLKQVGLTSTLQANRRLGFRLDVQYGTSVPNSANLNQRFSELSAMLSIRIQR